MNINCKTCPCGQVRKYSTYVNCLAQFERTPENCAALASILANGDKKTRLLVAAEALAAAEEKASQAKKVLLEELLAPSDSHVSGAAISLDTWNIHISQGWKEEVSLPALLRYLPDIPKDVLKRITIRRHHRHVTVENSDQD
jgi:hypothetical protein